MTRDELIDKIAEVLLDNGHNALHCHDQPDLEVTAEEILDAVLIEFPVLVPLEQGTL